MIATSRRTAQGIAAAVRSDEVSAEEVIRSALARADALQQRCNAFITIAREAAMARARALDASRAEGAALPLMGVPLVVKDNIVTRGLRTTAGSASLERFVPPYSATVIERLEAAGAVVIAKANLDEFGMGSSNENSAFGPVRNPWDLERVPGGSSGGSAAAVAAGVTPLALGTDTGGSVRQPGGFCGVIGFKPTYGLLSRYGVIAYASSLDQVGVLARSTSDVALALALMAGADPKDATSLDASVVPLASGDPPERLDGLRVGLVADLAGSGNSADVLDALQRTSERLEALGASVEEVRIPHARYAVAVYYLVATAEASSNLARYDGMIYSARRGENALGQAEVMSLSRGATLGPEVRRRVLMGTYALSAGYYDAYYGKALKVRRLIADDVDRAFGAVDLLLTPTAPTPAYRLGELAGDPLAMYLGDVDTCLANLVGVGAISVPAGLSADGLPVGVQFLAPALRDARLFEVVGALERSLGEAFAPLAPLAAELA